MPLASKASGTLPRLVVSQKTVEAHIGQILKLGLREAEGEDRRVAVLVAAVLAYLQAGQPG